MPRKLLLLMRHARASWTEGTPRDFDRPLSGSGRKDAGNMSRWLMEQGLRPERILCSPSLRTRETAEIVLQAYQNGIPIELEARLYEAVVPDLLEAVSLHAGHAGVLMVIGHNPGLDAFLTYLCPDPPRTASGKLMTTGAVAVVGVADWKLEPDRGELISLMRPKKLARESG